MQSGREDTLKERYAIKLCFKLRKNAAEKYGMLQTAFGASRMNRASVFEWHKRFKEGRESVRDDERCGRSKEVRTPELIGQIKNFMYKDRRVSIETISAQFGVSVGTQEGQTGQIHPQTFDDPFLWQLWYDLHALGSHWTDSQQGILCWGFKGVQEEIPSEEASTLQIGSVAFPAGQCTSSIFVTDYLTKVGIMTVPHPPYSPDLALCDIWLFFKLKEKLRGCRYETIEEIKEDFHGAFQKLLER